MAKWSIIECFQIKPVCHVSSHFFLSILTIAGFNSFQQFFITPVVSLLLLFSGRYCNHHSCRIFQIKPHLHSDLTKKTDFCYLWVSISFYVFAFKFIYFALNIFYINFVRCNLCCKCNRDSNNFQIYFTLDTENRNLFKNRTLFISQTTKTWWTLLYFTY